MTDILDFIASDPLGILLTLFTLILCTAFIGCGATILFQYFKKPND